MIATAAGQPRGSRATVKASTVRRLTRWMALFLAGLSLAACRKDLGVEQLAKAKAHYSALLQKSTPLNAPEFDALALELAAVPQDSSAKPEAARLEASLGAARKMLVRAPLAVMGAAAREPTITSQMEACAALAGQLGDAVDDAGRGRLMRALDDCRRRAEVLDARLVHSQHPEETHEGAEEDGGLAPR